MKKLVLLAVIAVLACGGLFGAYTIRVSAMAFSPVAIYLNGIEVGQTVSYFDTPNYVDITRNTAEELYGTWNLGPHPWAGYEWQPQSFTIEAPYTLFLMHFNAGEIIEDPTPVVLSAFTATLTGDFFVNVAWTSQTETQMMGYRVYRNTSDDQNSSMLINPTIVPATNTSETQTYNVVDNDVMVDNTYYYWLEAVEYNTSNFHGPVSVTVTGNVPPVLPEVTTMKNAYPNPFKAGNSANIEVALKAGETGTLTIYNVMGQVLKTVSLTEGSHTINWNGCDSRGTAVGSGIYFYKLRTPSLNQTKKMVIVK